MFRGNFYICEFSWNSLGCIIKKQVKSSNSSNLNGSKFVYLSVSMNMENHFLFARYDCVSNLKLFCVYFEGFVVASEDLSFIRTFFLEGEDCILLFFNVGLGQNLNFCTGKIELLWGWIWFSGKLIFIFYVNFNGFDSTSWYMPPSPQSYQRFLLRVECLTCS